MDGCVHTVHIYLEYQSVCPLVRIGTHIPSPARECVPSQEAKGGDTLACGWGEGSQFGGLEKKPSTMSTLRMWSDLSTRRSGGFQHDDHNTRVVCTQLVGVPPSQTFKMIFRKQTMYKTVVVILSGLINLAIQPVLHRHANLCFLENNQYSAMQLTYLSMTTSTESLLNLCQT